MEKDLPDPRLVASARQIMDIPMEAAMDAYGNAPGDDEALHQDTPLYITWFALGHAAVLLYLGLHALAFITPMERAMVGGSILVVGLSLLLLLRAKLRTGLAMAESVAPESGGRLVAEAED